MKLLSVLAVSLLLAGPVAAAGLDDLMKQGRDLLGSSGGTSGGSSAAVAAGLDNAEIAAGLKEALRVGTDTVVAQLGQPGGFSDDPKVRIPLPGALEQAKSALAMVGMADMAEDLELRMNRSAEAAIPQARELFMEAISAMSIDDARGILTGPDDSATRYFEGQMSAPLSERMKPIVDRALADSGAIQAYDAMIGEYESLPFVSDVKANLNDYVVAKGLDGLFGYVAVEEAAIRENPAARTTDLLKQVFGG